MGPNDGLAPMTRQCIAVLALALTMAGCKGDAAQRRDRDRDRDRANEPAAKATRAADHDATGARGLVPVWTMTVAGTPGLRLIEAATGPVLAGPNDELAVVGSSAIGFAAVELTSGRVRWQHREETRPGPIMKRGDALWLAGRCDRAADAPSDPGALVVGCVRVVTPATGALVRRLWISLPRALSGSSPGTPRGALGMSSSGTLLWHTGHQVWSIDPTSGVARAVCAAPDPEAAPVRGAFIRGDAVYILWSNAVSKCVVPASARGTITPAWSSPLSERIAAGAAGPIVAGDHLVWVRDEVLESRTLDGKTAWTARGRFAHCPTCLTTRGTRLRAIRLDARVSSTGALLGFASIDPGTGAVAASAGSLAAPQLLAAANRFLAVRADTSLRNDWVRTIDSAGVAGPGWHLPAPTSRRSSPVGLAAVGSDALVFYDGRHLVRLPAALLFSH